MKKIFSLLLLGSAILSVSAQGIAEQTTGSTTRKVPSHKNVVKNSKTPFEKKSVNTKKNESSTETKPEIKNASSTEGIKNTPPTKVTPTKKVNVKESSKPEKAKVASSTKAR